MKAKLDAKKKKEPAVEAAQAAEISAIPLQAPAAAAAPEAPALPAAESMTPAEAETNGIDATTQAQIEQEAMAEA